MPHKSWFVRTGDFFFKYRNAVFPLILLVLFVIFPPPAKYFGRFWVEDAKDVLAIYLIIAGLVFRLATIGWAYIKRGGLNKQVYADTLVTDGFFNICRNPLYVGNMLIYAGVFILHGHPAVVVAGIALYYFIYESIIAAEEYFLRNKFGQAYIDYCARVPRWIPDFSQYKKSTEDMSFSLTRSIAKDYTTIFNAILAIVAIEIFEHYFYYTEASFENSLIVGGVILGTLLLLVAFIKHLKKSGKLKVS